VSRRTAAAVVTVVVLLATLIAGCGDDGDSRNWQGRPDHLHDRMRYRRDGGGWRVERLAP
jgi:hypothetical protein